MLYKLTQMKTIQVTELWNTGRFILTDNEYQNPQVFAELRKYDNIVIDNQHLKKCTMCEAIIDNSLVMLCKNTVQHPQGGIIHIIEVV